MIKAGLLGSRAGGDDIADLYIVVRDNHPIDEQLDELPPLLEGSRVQPLTHPLAEAVHTRRGCREVHPALGVGLQLARLLRQSIPPDLQVVPPPSVLVQAQDLREVGLGQALDLLVQAGVRLVERRPSRLQLLGQPRAAVGARQRVREGICIRQHRAQVGPDRRVQVARCASPRGTSWSREERTGCALPAQS